MKKLQKNVKRRKKFKRISFKDRVLIESRYCIDKKSLLKIAEELKRHLSTITREINGKPRIGRGRYSADKAQGIALENSHKQGRMSFDPRRLKRGIKLVTGKVILWFQDKAQLELKV